MKSITAFEGDLAGLDAAAAPSRTAGDGGPSEGGGLAAAFTTLAFGVAVVIVSSAVLVAVAA